MKQASKLFYSEAGSPTIENILWTLLIAVAVVGVAITLSKVLDGTAENSMNSIDEAVMEKSASSKASCSGWLITGSCTAYSRQQMYHFLSIANKKMPNAALRGMD